MKGGMKKRLPKTWATAEHYPLRECRWCGQQVRQAARLTPPRTEQHRRNANPVVFLCEECFNRPMEKAFFTIDTRVPKIARGIWGFNP